MGSLCESYFEGTGILFEPQDQDAAVYYTREDPDLTWGQKKEIIICWFDTTYGGWLGFRYELRDSRQQMSAWLKRHSYASFEEFLQEDF